MTVQGRPSIFLKFETAKEKIRWDLPWEIAFFVYQYAKMEIYYDFLDKFVKMEEFHLCEIDTVSLYKALSAPTIEEAVKDNLKEEL